MDMRMFRFHLCLFFIMVTAVCFAGCRNSKDFLCNDTLGCVTLAPEDPIEIGAMMVLSGGLEAQGVMQVHGMEMAISDHDNRLMGHRVILRAQDSGCSSEAGINAALMLTTNPRIVGIVGTYCSGSATAAIPIISKAGMVMISGTNSAPSLTSINNTPGENWFPGYFRTMYNGIRMAQMAAVFAFQKLSITRAAVINDGDQFTTELTKEFERKFEHLGGTIVGSIEINKGDKDMGPALEALAYARPELIYFPLFEPEAIAVITQKTNIAGLENVKLIGSGGANSGTFIKAVGESGLGLYLTSVGKISNKRNDRLFQDYLVRYGKKPVHFSLPYAYDATQLLLSAIKSAAIIEPDGTLHIGRQALRDALYGTIDFDGITGRLSCDPFGDFFAGTYSIIRVDDISDGLEAFTSNIVYQYQ